MGIPVKKRYMTPDLWFLKGEIGVTWPDRERVGAYTLGAPLRRPGPEREVRDGGPVTWACLQWVDMV